MNSIWVEGVKKPSFEALGGSAKTDVLVIGGGMAGILCAYMLKRAGVDCILAEAGEICGGITKNTTAKITVGHGLIYDKAIKRFGEERARLYLEAQMRAVAEYSALCGNIDCDFEVKDSYVYSRDSLGKIEKEIRALDLLGCKAEYSEAKELPIETVGAVRVRDQAQFHPLKFAYSIAKDLPIYENTKIVELMPHGALTSAGEIKCEKIIVATHFPVLNKHGMYFLKMYQHRSYVLALKSARVPDGMYVDDDKKGMSFRGYRDMLLLGGGSHRTGKKGGNWHELEEFASMHYRGAQTVAKWATQDCMTLDALPYIGRYSKNTQDLYVAAGFNKWGMTSSMVAAMLLCELVRGKRSGLADLLSPSRSILRPQLAANAFETVCGLLTPTVPRCPHLGCALKYNPDEHSWDCPCHGSRFTDDGELIDNPATDDK